MTSPWPGARCDTPRDRAFLLGRGEGQTRWTSRWASTNAARSAGRYSTRRPSRTQGIGPRGAVADQSQRAETPPSSRRASATGTTRAGSGEGVFIGGTPQESGRDVRPCTHVAGVPHRSRGTIASPCEIARNRRKMQAAACDGKNLSRSASDVERWNVPHQSPSNSGSVGSRPAVLRRAGRNSHDMAMQATINCCWSFLQVPRYRAWPFFLEPSPK